MKKLFLIASLLLTACSQTAQNTANTDDRDFNFKFSYGYGPIPNELNTFNDTFIKDMVVDEPITVSMVLSDEEIKLIQEKIEAADLFTEPVQGDIRTHMDPCASYKLEVDYGDSNGAVEWNCENNNGGRAMFVDFMMDFIEGKEEYKALPEPQGGYM